MRKFLFFSIAVLILANCVIASLALVYFGSQYLASANSSPQPGIVGRRNASPIRTPSASGARRTIPAVVATSTPEKSNDTLEKLLALDIPKNDRLKLSAEYRGVDTRFATPSAPRAYKVGDKESFWVTRDLEGSYEFITATLRYITPHVYVWLEDGEQAADRDLQKSADTFENKIYPTNRRLLGSEATPGIDNDPHVFILNLKLSGRIAGYFWSPDTLPAYVNRHSNEHEMFYMNIRGVKPGTDYYASVLAHEFAHMIHDNQNLRGEGSWITEGFGELAIELNGMSVDHSNAFAPNPDLQLNAWSELSSPHYAASYLFLSYLRNRFGDDFIRDLISSNTHDWNTVQAALDKHAPGLRYDDVFADWVVANYINDGSQGSRYAYLPDSLNLRPTLGYAKYPVQDVGNVNQYGTDYLQLLPSNGEVTFNFDGSDTVRAIPTNPHSGKYLWWSTRTDNSDTRLTREFDLTNVGRATLEFWGWYDIEDNWDYAYVSVSTDDGNHWTSLKGNTTNDTNPIGANYGNGLTCKSDVGCGKDTAVPTWVRETMDLTPFAGKKILLRFQYLTDEVYARAGLALDDIQIPEIGFSDDAESGDNGWHAEGFARIDNVLPQRFIVQAIEFRDTPHVVQIALDENNRGMYRTQGFGQDLSRVIIVISGNTPITWERADYSFAIQ